MTLDITDEAGAYIRIKFPVPFHFLGPIDNFLDAAILTFMSEHQWADDWKDVLVLPLE